MGQRASDTRAVTFHDVKVTQDRIGAEGKGWLLAMAAFDYRPIVASAAVGLARAAGARGALLAASAPRSACRSGSQAVAFMIADMATRVEAARFLVWNSAFRIDRGERNTREAAMAKAFAADSAMQTAVDAVQVFGGYGFNREYPVEKLMRDAKVFQIYEGTSQIQRMIIARELFDRG
jgi:acyl-CoA dehydrogenase